MKISETTLNCCKPNRFITFKNAENSEVSSRKPRYKHYEQMSDEILSLRSVLKAHNEVEQSNKMRLFKAIPGITTALIGTSIALTQPGKLASKAAAGLGFLALTDVISKGFKHIDEKVNSKKQPKKEVSAKQVLKTTGKIALAAAGIAVVVVGFKNQTVNKFIKNEARQLANEINRTKLGKFVRKTYNPFMNKHAAKFSALSALAPLGIIAGSSLAQIELADSLSNDIKSKATKNFAKGKFIQAQARAHFDSIDAVEV